MTTIRVKRLPDCPECKSKNRRVFRYRGLGKVGQKVVCIDDAPMRNDCGNVLPLRPELGEIYTIRDFPGTGGARSAVNRAINTGRIGPHWETFEYWQYMRHEMRRALFGIDGPNAWCGRNARLRRIIEHFRSLPAIPLPR